MQIELKRLQHEVGITFVVVTHDQDEAMSLADRVAVMERGEVRQIGSPRDLYRHPTSVFVADFIGTSTMLRGRQGADDAWHTEGLPALPSPEGAEHALALALRPEDVQLVAPSAPGAFVDGDITEVLFQGDHVLAQVRCGTTPFLVAVRDGSIPRRGERTGLTWNVNAAIPLLEE
jgi:spermidine/putrescine transport system ATP-binding protein/putrescine transport system ATP-binding protein